LKTKLAIFAAIILFGFNPSGFNQTVNSKKNQLNNNFDYNGFCKVYQKFTNCILKADTTEFNKFINKELGLFIIEQPGSMPWFFKTKTIGSYLSPESWSFFNRQFQSISLQPKLGDLPVVDCDYANDSSAYNKNGCFVQKKNKLRTEKIWEYSEMDEVTKRGIELSASKISVTVINTYNYGFYFALIKNKWYLLFVDLRTPCSA
jgi:hypothetical protein